MHFPMSSAGQLISLAPGAPSPERGTDADRRLDDLLAATVALLMRTVSTLGKPEDEEGDPIGASPARSSGRIAADAARLTAAVAQLVRAHHLRSAPAPQAATGQANAALVALLTELDAEAEQERTRP
jgi:hypothetical protein